MASVTRNNLGPTVELYTKEDFGLVYSALDRYLDQVERTERRHSKYVYDELIRQRSGTSGFANCYSIEFSGDQVLATIRVVGSFVQHEILEDSSCLECLGSTYAKMIGVGLEMIHQAIEARYEGYYGQESLFFEDIDIAIAHFAS